MSVAAEVGRLYPVMQQPEDPQQTPDPDPQADAAQSVPPPPPPVGAGTTPPDPEKEARMWAMFCHLAAFSGYVVAMPFAGVVGPLVIWLIKKDEIPKVDEHGKEALNFQISVAIYFVASLLMLFVLVGFFMLIALAVFEIVCVIVAAVKAYQGESFRYPLCIRFIK